MASPTAPQPGPRGPRSGIACPACNSPSLSFSAAAAACDQCDRSYPPLGSIPCLLPDRAARLGRWRIQAAAFAGMMTRAEARIESDLARFDLLPRTRARLEGFRAANRANARQVLELLARGDITPPAHPGDDLQAQIDEEIRGAGGRLPLTHHYELLLRDWAWPQRGSDENDEARERITAALGPDRELGRLLVLGAGAGRLAHDLHLEHRPAQTLLLDLDPLLVLAAEQILFGPGLSLIEFPLAPDDADAVWVEHRLERPGPVPEGLHMVVGDAMRPPLSPTSADTVLTPWLLDVVDVDARAVIGQVHRLLAPGGRWINSGPLLYPPGRPPAQRFTPQELRELVELAGFEVEHHQLDEVRYLCSPLSAHARLEGVLTFVARKRGDPPASAGSPPAWVMLPHLPVERPRAARAASLGHPLLSEALALIDGERTLPEVAAALQASGRLPPGVDAHDATAALLLELHRILGGA